jgi:hypothetical protein
MNPAKEVTLEAVKSLPETGVALFRITGILFVFNRIAQF